MNTLLRDIGVCGAMIVVAALIWWEASFLPAGGYDPLGSGTMPQMIATIIIALALVAIGQSVLAFVRSGRPGAEPSSDVTTEEEEFERRPWLAVAQYGLLLVLAAALYLRLSFSITSTLFLFASAMLITKFERRLILPQVLASAALGFGLTYIFGTVLTVDLP